MKTIFGIKKFYYVVVIVFIDINKTDIEKVNFSVYKKFLNSMYMQQGLLYLFYLSIQTNIQIERKIIKVKMIGNVTSLVSSWQLKYIILVIITVKGLKKKKMGSECYQDHCKRMLIKRYINKYHYIINWIFLSDRL